MLRTHFLREPGSLRSQDHPEIHPRQAAIQAQGNPNPTQLMSEIKIHESLSHPNVVKFLHNF